MGKIKPSLTRISPTYFDCVDFKWLPLPFCWFLLLQYPWATHLSCATRTYLGGVCQATHCPVAPGIAKDRAARIILTWQYPGYGRIKFLVSSLECKYPLNESPPWAPISFDHHFQYTKTCLTFQQGRIPAFKQQEGLSFFCPMLLFFNVFIWEPFEAKEHILGWCTLIHIF